MDNIWKASFWKATGERAIKTFAGALITVFGADALNVFDVNVDWQNALGIALGTTLVSVLFSIASAPVGTSNGPSLANEVIEPK
jgi:hypothetical protein